jgi:hypothetical protein
MNVSVVEQSRRPMEALAGVIKGCFRSTLHPQLVEFIY